MRLGYEQVELSEIAEIAVLEQLHMESNSERSRHLSSTLSTSYHIHTKKHVVRCIRHGCMMQVHIPGFCWVQVEDQEVLQGG